MDGNVVELHVPERLESRSFAASRTPFEQMMNTFYTRTTDLASASGYQSSVHQDMLIMQTIDNIYASVGVDGNTSSHHSSIPDSGQAPSVPDCRFQWLVIDGGVISAVEKQSQESLSIYDNGGIFGKFEYAWKTYHDSGDSSALLHNSGTNALQALYFAAQFQPGDEVTFPVYSFHATSSPGMQFGITPIFCDALNNGNISPKAIKSAITLRTQAVVVTHMWGMPCDLEGIRKILLDHPKILLFEDCSHTHGAKIDGQPVGTFGDGVAWSLQGQKIVTGGEGGITLTEHADFDYRQLLWGHYNKRCKTQIPVDHPLRSFSLTGAGYKNCSHPLAVAIAFTQLQCLDNIHRFKSFYVLQMVSRLKSIPFLRISDLVAIDQAQMEPAWYALVVRFVASGAPKELTRESYVEELHQRGLCEVDIPKSNRLLHKEPLYTTRQTLFLHLYPDKILQGLRKNTNFPVAQVFYDEAIKLPVWTRRSDQAVVDHYLDVTRGVTGEKLGGL